MKSKLRCVISAAMVALLSLGVINYTFIIGKETKVVNYSVKEAAQSEVIVQDFIYDNYVISEKNPWTDYGLHPIQYKYDDKRQTLTESVDAKAAILVNVDSGTVLYDKNADQKSYPASTTKLMTALTVLQTMHVTDVVTVGDEVEMIAADSSKAGFTKGQVVSVQELLEGLLISSGNDAAYILAKATGKEILENNIANEGKKFTSAQCVQRFIFEMNKNVRDMELENTRFTSPDGYDDSEQYTTASDLSKIAIEAYENETIRDICNSANKYSKTLNRTWKSTNELINKKSDYYYENCVGLKTGSTDLAGKCLVSVAKNDNSTCISVVLGDDTDEQRWNDSINLLKFGLQN